MLLKDKTEHLQRIRPQLLGGEVGKVLAKHNEGKALLTGKGNTLTEMVLKYAELRLDEVSGVSWVKDLQTLRAKMADIA